MNIEYSDFVFSAKLFACCCCSFFLFIKNPTFKLTQNNWTWVWSMHNAQQRIYFDIIKSYWRRLLYIVSSIYYIDCCYRFLFLFLFFFYFIFHVFNAFHFHRFCWKLWTYKSWTETEWNCLKGLDKYIYFCEWICRSHIVNVNQNWKAYYGWKIKSKWKNFRCCFYVLILGWIEYITQL